MHYVLHFTYYWCQYAKADGEYLCSKGEEHKVAERIGVWVKIAQVRVSADAPLSTCVRKHELLSLCFSDLIFTTLLCTLRICKSQDELYHTNHHSPSLQRKTGDKVQIVVTWLSNVSQNVYSCYFQDISMWNAWWIWWSVLIINVTRVS